MEDYPQPVTGLTKDKSTEKKGIGIPTRYIKMTDQRKQQSLPTKGLMKEDPLEINYKHPAIIRNRYKG